MAKPPPIQQPQIKFVSNMDELGELLQNVFRRTPKPHTTASHIEPECWKITVMVFDYTAGQGGPMDFMTIEANYDLWVVMTRLQYRTVIEMHKDNTSQIRIEYPHGDCDWKPLLRRDLETIHGGTILDTMYEMFQQFPKVLVNQHKAN